MGEKGRAFFLLWVGAWCAKTAFATGPQREAQEIARLRCYSAETTLLDLLGEALPSPRGLKKQHQPGSELAAPYLFEFWWVHTSGPLLVKPQLGSKRPVQLIRHKDALEFNYFANPSYGENFEYRLDSGEFIYTQIFRNFGSAAHFYVGRGRCEVSSTVKKD